MYESCTLMLPEYYGVVNNFLCVLGNGTIHSKTFEGKAFPVFQHRYICNKFYLPNKADRKKFVFIDVLLCKYESFPSLKFCDI